MPVEPMDILPLVGYMDEPYARRFLTRRCVLPAGVGAEGLISAGREAVRKLGAAGTDAEVLPVQETALLPAVRDDPRIRSVVKGRGWSLARVEIDRLVSIQKYVNLTYAEAISRGLARTDPIDLQRFCLTDSYAARDAELFEARGADLFAIRAGGTDLRVVDSEAQREPATGAVRVSFTIGWGHPFVVVARLRGRYVLNNGNHRAYVLRNRGVKHIPCVLVEIDSYDDLECAGPPALFGPDVVMGERPPLFSGFFDPAVAPRVKMRPTSTAIVVRPTTTTLDPEMMDRYFAGQKGTPQKSADAAREYVDLAPRFEDWSVYELDDGTVLKVRAFMTRATRLPEGTIGAAVVSEPVWVANPPRGRKGPRATTGYTPDQLEASIVQRDIGFRTVREPVNEYVTEAGEQILMTLRLVSVSRTSRYDANGDAIYVFSTTRDVRLA